VDGATTLRQSPSFRAKARGAKRLLGSSAAVTELPEYKEAKKFLGNAANHCWYNMTADERDSVAKGLRKVRNSRKLHESGWVFISQDAEYRDWRDRRKNPATGLSFKADGEQLKKLNAK
jgi:hypothetical protein